MDPDANLDEQLRIADRIANGPDGPSEDWSRLAELVLSLDEWIAKGGALPRRWSCAQPLTAKQIIEAQGFDQPTVEDFERAANLSDEELEAEFIAAFDGDGYEDDGESPILARTVGEAVRRSGGG